MTPRALLPGHQRATLLRFPVHRLSPPEDVSSAGFRPRWTGSGPLRSTRTPTPAATTSPRWITGPEQVGAHYEIGDVRPEAADARPGWDLHQLRHSATTTLGQEGTPIRLVMAKAKYRNPAPPRATSSRTPGRRRGPQPARNCPAPTLMSRQPNVIGPETSRA